MYRILSVAEGLVNYILRIIGNSLLKGKRNIFKINVLFVVNFRLDKSSFSLDRF